MLWLRLLTLFFAAVGAVLWTLSAAAQTEATARPVSLRLDLKKRLGRLEIDRIGLGQGGLSGEPMWDNRLQEIRALHPRLIRLFIQEYFDLLPEKGKFHFDTLDRSVNLILKTGAKPLMCMAFKPHILFPTIDQAIVEPNDWDEWERLVEALVRHYKQKGVGIQYWEIGNEGDIGESGGCPFLFTAQNYPPFYERTAAAALRADPEARVGGPALANADSPLLPALLDYCDAHKTPLNFVSWHIYSSHPGSVRATIERVKAQIARHPSLHPETVLDEWNIDLGAPPAEPRLQPCYVAEVAYQMKEAGLDYACYYHIRDYHVRAEDFAGFMSPDGTKFMANWWNEHGQNSGLFDFEDRMRPAYYTFMLLAQLKGDRLSAASSDNAVHAFCAVDDATGRVNVLMWNFSATGARVSVVIDGLDGKCRVDRHRLDSTSPSRNGAASRLQQEAPVEVDGDQPVEQDIDPYGVVSWSFRVKGSHG